MFFFFFLHPASAPPSPLPRALHRVSKKVREVGPLGAKLTYLPSTPEIRVKAVLKLAAPMLTAVPTKTMTITIRTESTDDQCKKREPLNTQENSTATNVVTIRII